MKTIGYSLSLAVIVLVLHTGCDYRVALVEEPSLAMNTDLVGLWEHRDQRDRRNRMLVLPLDPMQHLVVFTHEDQTPLYGRAMKWQQEDFALIQIAWIGTGEGVVPDQADATFQYVKYVVEDDVLRARLLHTDLVPQDIESAEDLIQLIEKHRKDPALFRNEIIYHRIDT